MQTWSLHYNLSWECHRVILLRITHLWYSTTKFSKRLPGNTSCMVQHQEKSTFMPTKGSDVNTWKCRQCMDVSSSLHPLYTVEGLHSTPS